MAKYKVTRALHGFALKVGDVVTGSPIENSDKAFMQNNVFVEGDCIYTHFKGVIYDFQRVE